jgi:hypothetical protein
MKLWRLTFEAENSLQASVADLNQLNENPDPRKRKAGTGSGIPDLCSQ